MLKLPENLRKYLKKPQGRIVSAGEVKNPVACVGDVVSYTLLSSGFKPGIIIFDGRSERRPFSKLDELKRLTSEYVEIRAKNPPSTLTMEVVMAIAEAVRLFEEGLNVRIFVEGEEDLTLMPLLCALRSGRVVYGQPGEGMVEVEVTGEKKLLILQLLERMEKNGKNGDDVIDMCRRWVNGSGRGI